MCAVGQEGGQYYLQNYAGTKLQEEEKMTTIAQFRADHPYISIHVGTGKAGLGIFTGFMPYAG
jgi:hypothetical protein